MNQCDWVVIAELTLREAARKWLLWTALGLGGVFLVVYALGISEIQKSLVAETANGAMLAGRSEFYNFYSLAGLYVVNFLAAVVTVLISVDAIAGEITSGAIHTVLSKPIRRRAVYVGKWIGFSAMLGMFIGLMGGGVVGVVYMLSGYLTPNFVMGILLIWGNAEILLSLSFLGGSVLTSLTNGMVIFGLYALAFIGGWIEQIGALVNNSAAIQVGIISSLVMPGEAVWKRAAFEMQSELVSAIGGISFFTSGSTPSIMMLVYALFYVGVVWAVGMHLFARRDL